MIYCRRASERDEQKSAVAALEHEEKPDKQGYVHESTGVILRKPPLPSNVSNGSNKNPVTTRMSAPVKSDATPRQKQLQDKLEKIKEQLAMVRNSCGMSSDDDRSPAVMRSAASGNKATGEKHIDTPRPPRPVTTQFVEAGTPSVSFKVKSFINDFNAKDGATSPESYPVKRKAAEMTRNKPDSDPLQMQLSYGDNQDKNSSSPSKANKGEKHMKVYTESARNEDIKVNRYKNEEALKSSITKANYHDSIVSTDRDNTRTDSDRSMAIQDIYARRDIEISSPVEKRKRLFEQTHKNVTINNDHASATRNQSQTVVSPTKSSILKSPAKAAARNKPATVHFSEIAEIKQLDDILKEYRTESEDWINEAVASNQDFVRSDNEISRRHNEIGSRPEPKNADVSLSVEFGDNMDIGSESLDDILQENLR